MPKKIEKSSVSKMNVKLESVLFEFIETLVLLYKHAQSYYIATAMPIVDGIITDYFVVSVTPEALGRYLREECDLRFLFVSARQRRYYILAASELGNEKVELASYEGDPEETWLPEAQFFASSHTNPYRASSLDSVDKKTLQIAGNWEMEDFGSFSGKFRDLYAFEDALNKIENSNLAQKIQKKIKAAFNGKPFRGGSSYVNFFRDLVSAQPRDERFDLRSIKYASPGQIELAGKGNLFDTLEARIENFVSNQGSLRNNYNEFHKYMSVSKLLEIQGVQTVPSKMQCDNLDSLSKSLLVEMKMDIFSKIYELSESNALNTAKITLALYRRLHSAADYFAQGRIAY